MNTLEKLRDELHEWSRGPEGSAWMVRMATTLDAYIKKQESVEPVAWMNRSGDVMQDAHKTKNIKEGEWGGEWSIRAAVSQQYDKPLYAAPPPREPITREAVYLAAKKLELTHLALEFGGLLSELGIEVKP